MRVLLVEDDPMIGEAVEYALKNENYAVDWVQDGLHAVHAAQDHPYDVVLLDLGLPRLDGLQVLKSLREKQLSMALIILTARDSAGDRIRGLDLGADDYLAKPFDMGELLARIRAVIRRKGGAGGPLLSNGLISLDPVSHEVLVEGKSVVLTGREFALLHALLLRPGAILSRSELESRMYGWNEEIESNVVEFMISSLRKKLGDRSLIRNVRGVGWMVARQ